MYFPFLDNQMQPPAHQRQRMQCWNGAARPLGTCDFYDGFTARSGQFSSVSVHFFISLYQIHQVSSFFGHLWSQFLDILWRTGLISTSNCPDEKTSDGLVWVETNGPVIWTCNKPEAAEV